MSRKGEFSHLCGKKICDELGLPRNSLYQMRRTNIDAFNYMVSLDTNIIKAYRAYVQEKREVTDTACDINHWLDDNRLKKKYAEFLVANGIYKTYECYPSVERTLFSQRGIVYYSTLLLIRRANNLFSEFKGSL